MQNSGEGFKPKQIISGAHYYGVRGRYRMDR